MCAICSWDGSCTHMHSSCIHILQILGMVDMKDGRPNVNHMIKKNKPFQNWIHKTPINSSLSMIDQ